MLRPAPDLIDYEHLSRLVVEGARWTASELLARGEMSQVVGYALLPDEEIGDLADVVCGRELADPQREPTHRFDPVEWSGPEKMLHFQEANVLLARRVQLDLGGDHFTQNDRAFEALVRALIQVRSADLFPADAFFTICVADADETSEYEAIPRLNPPAVVRDWRLSRLASARQWLNELCSRPEPRSFAEQDRERLLRVEIASLEEALRIAG